MVQVVDICHNGNNVAFIHCCVLAAGQGPYHLSVLVNTTATAAHRKLTIAGKWKVRIKYEQGACSSHMLYR